MNKLINKKLTHFFHNIYIQKNGPERERKTRGERENKGPLHILLQGWGILLVMYSFRQLRVITTVNLTFP